jgi:hypothetical protein
MRWTCTGVHTGDGLGFPASGRKATLLGSSFIVCRDGQIIDAWNFMDLTKLALDLQSK